MNAKELKELIEFLIEKDITEFELERGDVKMRMKRGSREPQYAAAPSSEYAPPVASKVIAPAGSSVPPVPVAGAEPAQEAGLHIVRSPIVGTFYEAASPGAAPFVQAGDTVQAGHVLCIIEAMKLMNEIEADVSGTIVKRLVENTQPVEYGQPLFAIRPA